MPFHPPSRGLFSSSSRCWSVSFISSIRRNPLLGAGAGATDVARRWAWLRISLRHRPPLVIEPTCFVLWNLRYKTVTLRTRQPTAMESSTIHASSSWKSPWQTKTCRFGVGCLQKSAYRVQSRLVASPYSTREKERLWTVRFCTLGGTESRNDRWHKCRTMTYLVWKKFVKGFSRKGEVKVSECSPQSRKVQFERIGRFWCGFFQTVANAVGFLARVSQKLWDRTVRGELLLTVVVYAHIEWAH